VIRIDGRDLHPSPAGFRRALSEALHRDEGRDVAAPFSPNDVPVGAVLLIDTFEKIEVIGTWLREHFLPGLPARCLLVFAGRNQPAREWRTDIDWAGLTHSMLLGNLGPKDADAYLTARGVAADRFEEARAFTHGHPLALSLVADVLSQGAAAFDAQRAPDVIKELIDCFLRDVPSHRHREAIEVCAQLRNTTEALLAATLEGDDAPALFDWLRHLSFIEEGPHGVFPHDLARGAFMADLLWRNPPHAQQRFARSYLALIERIKCAAGREKQRLTMEYLFLIRTLPPWHSTALKRLTKTPKLHFLDSGLLAALRLSGLEDEARSVEELLAPEPVAVDRDRAWAALGRDKKASGGRITLVLLERRGAPRVTSEVDPADVRDALDGLIA
jgi:hypothetical protein